MKRAELDRLRARLRDADPAAGVDGPSAEQRARMRRSALASLAERPDPIAGRRFPRWAFAAVVALTLAAGTTALRVLRDDRPRPEREAGTESVPVEAAAPPVTRATAPGSAAPGSPVIAETMTGAAAVERQTTRPPASPALTARAPRSGTDGGEAASPAAEAAPPRSVEPIPPETLAALPAPLGRQLQLTAPGGTRIVWILAPAGP